MSLATPIILGLTGTPIIDTESASQSRLVYPVSGGNATPCVLVASGPALLVNLSLYPIVAEATSWVNAVIANGGSVSAVQRMRVNLLITALKAGGCWALADDYLLQAAESSIQALTSLKQLRLGTAVNSPAFTALRGYAYNGTTSYVDSGFIPATHAVNMTGTNCRAGMYELVNVTNSGIGMGANSSANRTIRIRARNAGNALLFANANSATYTLPALTSIGYTTGSRVGADNLNAPAYKNGVAMTRTIDYTGFGATLPIVSIFVGGYNNGGALTSPRPCTVGAVGLGAQLTAAQELAEYRAFQSYMISLGATGLEI